MKPNKRKLKRFKKTNVYPFLSRLYAIFKTKPEIFELKKLYDCQGECDWEEDTISLDYRREFITTIIHEVLHYIHPNWSETQVLREEQKIMNSLSVCQVRHIVKKFAQFL